MPLVYLGYLRAFAAPSVVSVSPANGTTNVLESTSAEVTFSESIDPTTCTEDSLYLMVGSQKVPAATACSENRATITPTAMLGHMETYELHVTASLRDRAGVPLAENFASSFVTRNVIYMFRTGGTGGNLGGRSGADTLCVNAYSASYATLGCSVGSIHAFLSVSSGDEMRAMPTNHGVLADVPVRGPTGILIDSNFGGLVDGVIGTTLQNAGVLPDANWTFWHASNDQGAYDNLSCSNWTNGSGGLNFGRKGSNDRTSSYIELGGLSTCDDGNQRVVCLCSK